MIKIIVIVFLTLAIQTKVNAQSKAEIFKAKNALFVEVGGNAGRYAVNYERLFYHKGAFKLAGSVGLSFISHRIGTSTFWGPILPLGIHGFIGRSNHHLELGAGYTPYLNPTTTNDPATFDLIKDSNQISAILPLRIGYRYQKPEGGFYFRVGYTPFFNLPDRQRKNFDFQPIFGGLSLGKCF